MLAKSMELIRSTLRTHLVVAMLAQPAFDAVADLARHADMPGLENRLVSGLDTVEVALGQDLWAMGNGRLDEAEFLTRHGHHAPGGGGLQLTAPSWRADPRPLRELAAGYAGLPADRSPEALLRERRAARAAAVQELMEALPRARRLLAPATLRLAWRFIPLRELGRSTWVRLVDAGRAGLEVLAASGFGGAIEDPTDLHYFTIDEILGHRAPDPDQLARRRHELKDYEQLELALSWWGDPTPVPASAPAPREEDPMPASVLDGVAVGGGTIEGIARVVHDPGIDGFEPGEILVCPQTDPGWVSLFLLASAVVTDTGGALSHSAIVARELGIPAVTNTRDASRVIRSGDRLRVDADAGTVRVLERA